VSAPGNTAVLHIATPEGVTFSLPLAGPVTRALALMVDVAVCQAIQQILFIAVKVMSVFAEDMAGGAAYLIMFLIAFGYSSVCELLFGGQTLGKRIVGIRVMDERGLRLLPGQVIVRNLLRVVDMFPVFYAVGGVFALFSKRCQRLGDLAAGRLAADVQRSAADGDGGGVEGAAGDVDEGFRGRITGLGGDATGEVGDAGGHLEADG
jgi:uncharacterized RDD family membrane protein YckC